VNKVTFFWLECERFIVSASSLGIKVLVIASIKASLSHNKRLKRDCQRVAALVQNWSSVFIVCFLSSAVRCQPL